MEESDYGNHPDKYGHDNYEEMKLPSETLEEPCATTWQI